MKKNVLFPVLLIVIGVLLFLLKVTGIGVHIALSVVGLVVLIAYTVTTKKEWKTPALEILMRVFYGVALITGVVVMNVTGIAALAIVHKACGALFLVLLVVLFVQKLRGKN